MNPYYKDGLTTIYCGDSMLALREIEETSVDMIITSPPYNCRKEYPDGDEVAWPYFYNKMHIILSLCYGVLSTGGVIAVNMPGVVRWQAEHEYANSWIDYDPGYKTRRNGKDTIGKGRIEPVGFKIFNIMFNIDKHLREPIVWVKGSDNNAISSDYRMGCDSDPYMRPAHEMIFLGSKDRWYHRGGTGRRGKDAVPFLDYTKDVWFVTPESNKYHPAVFPREIPLRLMKLFIHTDDAVVLDPFMGSGTTLDVARMLGYKSIGIDVSEKYCEIAANKFSQRDLFYVKDKSVTGNPVV